jgi:hypothetical protein
MAMTIEQQQALALASARLRSQQAPEEEFGVTDTWPFRLARGIYESGKDAAMLPGQVYSGEKPLGEITPGDTLNFAGAVSPLNPAVRAGERAIPGMAGAGKGAPSRKVLGETASRQFDDFRKTGIKIPGDTLRQFSQRVRQELEEKGVTEVDAPATYAKIKFLEAAPEGGFMSATNFHSARKSFGKTAGNYAPDKATDRMGSSIVIDRLDEFLGGLDETGFMAGTPPGAGEAAKSIFKEATGNYAAAKRSDMLTGKVHDAELRAAAANSGRNVDNAIRQRMAGTIINSGGKGTRGFNSQEVAGMEGVVRGSRPNNAVRATGNLLGGGGGLGALLASVIGAGGGGLAMGPLGGMAGAALPLVGTGLKGIENALTKSAVGKLDDATRARSPLAEKGVTGPATDAATRAALARLLLLYQMQNPNSL